MKCRVLIERKSSAGLSKDGFMNREDIIGMNPNLQVDRIVMRMRMFRCLNGLGIHTLLLMFL